MEGFIRFITDPQNLLSLGVGVLVFATVLTLLSSMTGSGTLMKAGTSLPSSACTAV